MKFEADLQAKINEYNTKANAALEAAKLKIIEEHKVS